jgi:hypothetical protein
LAFGVDHVSALLPRLKAGPKPAFNWGTRYVAQKKEKEINHHTFERNLASIAIVICVLWVWYSMSLKQVGYPVAMPACH